MDFAFDVTPMINIPEVDKSAEKVCVDLKIKSQNDKEKLAKAKRLIYLEGFTDGTMLVGEFEGKSSGSETTNKKCSS